MGKKLIRICSGISLFLIGLCAQAQNDELKCGSDVLSMEWEIQMQRYLAEMQLQTNGQTRSSASYTIPVVFHVIHGGESVGVFPNLSEGQIQSQIQIINGDFSANPYNLATYPANAFVQWASAQNLPATHLDSLGRVKVADLNVQVCPAMIDPNGNMMMEPGINRINYISKGWPNPVNYSTQSTMKAYLDTIVKPGSVWDVTRYLNVWITDKSNALTYAGVSSGPPFSGLMDLPNNATLTTDGIWCYSKAIGAYSIFPGGSYISQFIDGRTLTHELGHYLGLRHIWGDVTCGNDFCADTPPAAAENTLSPTYPHNVGTCTNPSNSPDGEMFMNFMDYTRGPSKVLFTTDQKNRVQTAMQNSPFRNQLGTHGLCSVPSRNEISSEKMRAVQVYPNPSVGDVSIQSEAEIIKVQIRNVMGVLLEETQSLHVSLGDYGPGIYIFTIETDKGHYSVSVVCQ
jgi:hypothetical protein